MSQISWEGLFELQPAPTPAKASTSDCAYCGHPKKMHCEGGVFHANYKDQMRMMKSMRGSTCTNRHCESPICDCTNYQGE